MSTYCQSLVPNVARFLRSYDHLVTPPNFYVIPKIHKTPMVGRPIAASHSYITRPISIFVDELVKTKIRMPTVLRGSSELIQLLEHTALPNTNCFLVTADVASLCGYQESSGSPPFPTSRGTGSGNFFFDSAC